MSYSYIQSAGAAPTNNGATTMDFLSNTTAGNLVAVWIENVGANYPPSVTDNFGNTYSTACTFSSGGGSGETIFYTFANTTGQITITCNQTFWNGIMSEYSGVNSFDTGSFNVQPSATSPFSSDTISVAHNNSLIVSALSVYNGSGAFNSPVTFRKGNAGFQFFGDYLLSSAGSTSFTGTGNNTGANVGIAAFYQASAVTNNNYLELMGCGT